MNRCLLAVMSVLLIFAIILIGTGTAFAAATTAPDASNIIVTNNITGKADTVYIYGVDPGNLIKVYNAAKDGRVLQYGTVAKNKIDITFNIEQLGTGAGSVYVSVISKGSTESSRVRVDYEAEERADAPAAENVLITNNAQEADVIIVSGLEAKSTVKIYNAAAGGKTLGTKASPSGADVTFKVAQLGTEAGSVYVTVSSKDRLESYRTKVNYDAELASEALTADNVTINNNANTSDTIYINYLSAGDLVRVYREAAGNKILGRVKVSASKYDATIIVPQLGTEAGSVYISITSDEYAESKRVKVDYSSEGQSEKLNPEYITVTNHSGQSDTVYITGLSGGDVIKVYNAESNGNLLGSTTVSGPKSEAIVTIPQIGTVDGYIYVTVTNTGKSESKRMAVSFVGESKSSAVSSKNVTVTNNVGGADTIYVTGVSGGDVVRVYDSSFGGALLGSKTVPSSAYSATLSMPQLGVNAGSIYVTVTNSGKAESEKIKIDYAAEGGSTAPEAKYINITNNAGESDTIYITKLSPKDKVMVYRTSNSGAVLVSGTVGASDIELMLTISQLGTAAGSLYISVASEGCSESDRTYVTYSAESDTESITADNFCITNNAGISDEIYVMGISAGTVVRVYSAPESGSLLGSATASSSDVSVMIGQLGNGAGSVYVTIAQPGLLESERIEVAYGAEGISDAPNVNSIVVINNVGQSDTVYVSNLSGSDVVRVYSTASQGKVLGTATVPASATEATVSVPQLGTAAGSIYVSVTNNGYAESSRTEAVYKAEGVSDELDIMNISITNNVTLYDTVYLTELSEGDLVKVYDAAAGGTLLGSAAVGNGATNVTVSIPQLGPGSGSVYISVTSAGRSESRRIEAAYAAEASSDALDPNRIVAVNNLAGTADMIIVSGLNENDIIRTYSAATQGKLLGTATVAEGETEVIISIAQLGTADGSVYVSVTHLGKKESTRIEVQYTAEEKSTAPTSISVTNNAGGSDTVVVTGLMPGDLVRVYNKASGGTLLGSVAADTSSTEAIVAILQLGSSAGSVYVSVTSVNKDESLRTEAPYAAEIQSEASDISDVIIINNSGIASTVTVKNLKENDLVKVYSAASGGTLLGSGNVETYYSEVTIYVSQLVSAGGTVYISVTSENQLESSRTAVPYGSKAATAAPEPSGITTVNNYGIADTVTAAGLESGSVVKVYREASGGTAIGLAEVSHGKSEATVSITQLGTGEGTIYVTATGEGKTESDRTAVTYPAEAASDALEAGNITVVNNSGKSDTVKVTGLDPEDVIRVYNMASGGSRLASATVEAGSLYTVINISQLGTASGSIYVSVTRSGRSESGRTEVEYEAESTAPKAANISIENNAGISDAITVYELAENDLIKVYDAASNGNLLGLAAVPAGSSQVKITVSQLTKTAGYVYISATNYGKAESSLTKAAYIAEQSTTAPYIGDIYVVNNVDIDDTITVYNLAEGDVIMAYSDYSGGNLLGYATVADDMTEAAISVEDLGSGAGTVYISLTTKGKSESSRTVAGYVGESKSTAPYSGYIYVSNNVTISDIVIVSGLSAGDKIKVYNAPSGGDLLGNITVATGSAQGTVSISQLGTQAGSIFVSVTSRGKTESDRTEAEYVSEQRTNEAYTGYIAIVNNAAGISDKVTVSQLLSGDIIKVYDALSGGNLLGTAVVATGSTNGVVTITQLGTSAGSVYVTITTPGKAESNRTKADYISE